MGLYFLSNQEMITILILVFSTTVNAQQKNSVSPAEIDDIMKWRALRQRVERAVNRGKLDRIEADKKYSNFRAKMNGRKIEYKDPILEKHFKKYGIENVPTIKNILLDEGIPINKLEAVLGGILRLMHAAKLDKSNFRMNPRYEVYFKNRLGLTNNQIDQILAIVRAQTLN